MTLEVGKKLGPYEILSPIGAGGMGEVYRARDTKLGREVAIKVLPEAFAENEERLARFEREARLLASLNHPNIATLYGFEHSDGVHFLAMELADGETLAEQLQRGAIPLDDALPIFKQIAEALEAAHEKGIIHRDLKPANIKFSSEGKVKVLDFGLAKAMSGDPAKGEVSESPTITRDATATGVVLGTAAYMAPEQARGKPVDQRADVWAFGVVLYEVLTGKRAFAAEDVTLTLAAVVTSNPDLAVLPNAISPSLKLFLGRCLKKDPRTRVQAIGDMRLALEGAFDISLPEVTPPEVSRLRVAVPWLIAAGAIVVALWALVSERRVQNAVTTLPRPQRSFTIDSPEGTVFPRGIGPVIAISPDGETVVFSAENDQGRQLYRRALAEFEATPVRGTEGAPSMPFFSPDGRWVAFGDGTSNEMRRVPLEGGDPFLVCSQCGGDGHWSETRSIVFGVGGKRSVFRVPETGGDPEAIVEPMLERGIVAVNRPILLPGGAAVLFDINPFGCGGIGVVSLENQELIVVTENGTDPFYSPSGHILFGREHTLYAVPFDVSRLEVTGPETPVLSGVRVENGGAVQAKLSRNGTLVYLPADQIGTRLVLVDRDKGQIDRVLEEGRFFRAPRVSPDGRRIAVQINAGGSCDVWIHEAETLRPLTNTDDASNPIWTPDGRSISFSSRSNGSFAIQSVASDGAGEVLTLMTSNLPIRPEAWSQDGTHLIFREDSSTPDLFVTDIREPDSRTAYVVSDFSERSARLSPSGGWVAYVSNQSGSDEVYVRPFPGPGRERRVSPDGGEDPVWGRADTELVFRSVDTTGPVSVASLRLERSEIVEHVKALFDVEPYWSNPGQIDYDMYPDGRLLMLSQRDPAATRSRIHVIENWFLDLNQLAGENLR